MRTLGPNRSGLHKCTTTGGQRCRAESSRAGASERRNPVSEKQAGESALAPRNRNRLQNRVLKQSLCLSHVTFTEDLPSPAHLSAASRPFQSSKVFFPPRWGVGVWRGSEHPP